MLRRLATGVGARSSLTITNSFANARRLLATTSPAPERTEGPPDSGTRPVYAREKKRSPILTETTQKKLQEIEKLLGYPCIAYWNSYDGSVCHGDVMVLAKLLSAHGKRGHKRIGMFIKSEGGDPEAALRMMHLLRGHAQNISVFAPYSCASSATMLCLGADEIHMGATSYLTSVDSSLSHPLNPRSPEGSTVSVSQNQLSRILNLWKAQPDAAKNPWPEVYKYLNPIVVGELDRSSSLSMRICKDLLSFHMKDEAEAERIAKALNHEYPSHTFPITLREARKLGLHVKELNATLETQLQQLNDLYSTMAQKFISDYDNQSFHKTEIVNIVEGVGQQYYYQVDLDSHYRAQERRWANVNDVSSWMVAEVTQDGVRTSHCHIR